MSAASKHFQRFRQRAGERFSVREKSERLTASLSDAEKKVEEIRNSCQPFLKKLNACIRGSGNTFEKHQKKLPQFALGTTMCESTNGMEPSVLSNVLMAAGKSEIDISKNLTEYEMEMNSTIIQPLTTILEEGMKKIDKSKKKLNSARLDMDGTRNRYQSIQDKFSPKAELVKSELDQAINHFEQCQDTYATDLFAFLSREREIASILHKMVVLQITHYQQTLNILNEVLPNLDKELDDTTERPVFGFDLEEHLETTERTISYVIEECCLALRERGTDSEGIFRLAASAAKLKLLKNAFDAGYVELDNYDPHTIAGALKQYLRELPNPLLTYGLHSDWIAAAGVADESQRLQQLWTVVQKLPKKNYDNLKYLMYFFNELSQYHEETKMNINNIAIVVGPNLLWSKGETLQGLVGETALYTRTAECLIKQPSYFFGEAPVLPPIAKKRPQKLIPAASDSSSSLATENEETTDTSALKTLNGSVQSIPSEVENDVPMSPVAVTSPLHIQTTPTSNTQQTTQQTVPQHVQTTPVSSVPQHVQTTPVSSVPQHVQTTSSEEKPTPPIRRNRSVRQNQQSNSVQSNPAPSSPRTPTARRPAPQPPPAYRPKPRPPPPSPPKDKPFSPSPKDKPLPPPVALKPNRQSLTDKEETQL